MNQKYSEDFKLSIVKEYFEGNLGVRMLAKKYNLPSKNYVTNWIKHFKDNGTISKDITVSRHSGASAENTNRSKAKTSYERELEKKLERVEMELAFYKKCDEIIKRNKKK